ncbi:MAG: hypothetical protein V1770_03355 [bacterium]
MKNFAKISQLIKQDLQLTYEPASVKFSDIPSINISRKTNGSYYADTACTALCRCFKDNKLSLRRIAQRISQSTAPSQSLLPACLRATHRQACPRRRAQAGAEDCGVPSRAPQSLTETATGQSR